MKQPNQTPVTAVEIALFHLKDRTQRESLTVALQESTQWLQKQLGFVRRETFEEPNGTFFDVVHWSSLDAAEQAFQKFALAQECSLFESLIDEHRMCVFHARPTVF